MTIENTIISERYINEILPIAPEDDGEILSRHFIFQKCNESAHRDKITQHLYEEDSTSFRMKGSWLAKSPDLTWLKYDV